MEAGKPLAGRRVVVSAGGTREPLDPVRYLGNRSSGKQGYALAQVAAARGAAVTLVSANVSLPAPDGVEVVAVGTALELQDAVTRAAKEADVVVMAAAVADFRPKDYAAAKIKKTHAATADGSPDESAPTIELVRNPDILAGLVESRGAAERPLIVGFAAETGDATGSVMDLARAKLARKGCDLLVANEVGRRQGLRHRRQHRPPALPPRTPGCPRGPRRGAGAQGRDRRRGMGRRTGRARSRLDSPAVRGPAEPFRTR